MKVDNTVEGIDIFGSWVEAGMVLAALGAGILLGYPMIKSFLRKRKEDKSIWKELPTSEKFVSLHTKVHEHLTELRVLGDAGRAQVIQFHNGGKFIDGSSMKRFSLTHESCRSGVSETRDSRQDVILTMFGEMLEIVTATDPTPKLTSELPDCHFKRHLESNSVVLFSLIPIRNASGMSVIGYLSVEWCSWVKADAVIEEDVIPMMKEKRRYIEAELAAQTT
tara:strand:- start:11 stop:676 length:666 start_codon:yes stop_codon:yes gene_type:complete